MLFDTAKHNSSGARNSLTAINHPESFISSQDDYLSKYLREIDFTKDNQFFHFTSNGRFALHDMLIHIAAKIGNAECLVTSFNISVIAAKMFIRAWDKGLFKSLGFVLNAQKKHNFKDAIKLIDGKFPMIFGQLHAKVGLLWNDKNYITIVTSGNLSNNNNIERGFISTSKEVFDFDKNWIDGLFEN